MVDEDVRGRRGIFREDHVTTDAADAAAMAAGQEVPDTPDWKQRVRQWASRFAAERARSDTEGGDQDTAAASLPRAVLVMAVEPRGEGSPPLPELPGGGEVEVELRSDVVPKTVANFCALCTGEKGTVTLTSRRPDGSTEKRRVRMAYEGTRAHRVVPGFILQAGDITNGDGTGGRSIYGARFDDENFKLKHGPPGAVAMANRGPGTNSSQFYFTLGRTPWLDGKHVVFGRVVRGLAVLDAISTLGSESGVPAANIIIRSATVKEPEERS